MDVGMAGVEELRQGCITKFRFRFVSRLLGILASALFFSESELPSLIGVFRCATPVLFFFAFALCLEIKLLVVWRLVGHDDMTVICTRESLRIGKRMETRRAGIE